MADISDQRALARSYARVRSKSLVGTRPIDTRQVPQASFTALVPVEFVQRGLVYSQSRVVGRLMAPPHLSWLRLISGVERCAGHPRAVRRQDRFRRPARR